MKCSWLWPLVGLLLVAPVARGEPPTSASPAKMLCDLMAAKHLDAFAARDAAHPDRFVAALLYPQAELLVVAAKYKSPDALQGLLDRKQYRDVYADLQTGLDAAEQVFFIDMKADGIGPGSADVVYEPGNKQTIFDDTWRKQHGLDEHAYLEKYQAADQLYGSLLQTLVTALNASQSQ